MERMETYIAGDLFNLLHVLIQRSVMSKCVTSCFGLVVLHLIDNLKMTCKPKYNAP